MSKRTNAMGETPTESVIMAILAFVSVVGLMYLVAALVLCFFGVDIIPGSEEV